MLKFVLKHVLNFDQKVPYYKEISNKGKSILNKTLNSILFVLRSSLIYAKFYKIWCLELQTHTIFYIKFEVRIVLYQIWCNIIHYINSLFEYLNIILSYKF